MNVWGKHSDDQVGELVAKLTNVLNRAPTRGEVEAAASFELPTGLRDVRLHDFRRTVGSWLAQRGNSLHLIGRVLNHSNQATTAIYARFAEDHVRTALDEHGRRVLEVAQGREQLPPNT